MEERIDCLERRISELEKAQNKTEIWQAKYGEKIENIGTNITEMKELIASLANKPQKRWDTLISTVISTLVAAAIAFFIGSTRQGG